MQNDSLKFKKKVFDIVKTIPRGRVLTYKEVARLTGSPKAFRAVGNILNKNYDKTIPCHRVIRSDGKTGGYNRGSHGKILLLKKEGALRRYTPQGKLQQKTAERRFFDFTLILPLQ